MLLACCLAAHGARAAGEDVALPCAPGVLATMSDAEKVARMRAPVALAVARLDAVQIAFPSPTLASRTISYFTLSPNFTVPVEQICVLGYFELVYAGRIHTTPLQVESVEMVRDQSAEHIVTRMRVYFRVPSLHQLRSIETDVGLDELLTRGNPVHLKVAAFEREATVASRSYFGRDLPVIVSSKRTSILQACLFALVFYLVAGCAVPRRGRAADGLRQRLPELWGRLAPWNITGATGQASLSQLQMLVFTLIVATLLFYQWLRTGLLQELSNDLLYLIGISTAGTAATQAATTIRKELDPAMYQYLQELGWFTAPFDDVHAKASAKGLLMTNRRFDIYKFQMLVFTFVIAAYVIASGADELGNIQISATLLTLMGMSQGVYVGGRAAADGLSPLQDQLRGMQVLQQRCQAESELAARVQLQQAFRQAAAEAGVLFSRAYGRVLPPALLEMPEQGALPSA
ncbi:hypothetical protein [Massilia sp. CF038]|uniref:hypothetical protein n=1 Tax=Massilia sp. CF038 TaxID=1881045 RepID=UPI0009336620|nr:hypothetical protein [Massilia sp. CF038]